MNLKIILSVGLIMGLTTVVLLTSDSRGEAQNQVRVVGDTGVVSVGPRMPN